LGHIFSMNKIDINNTLDYWATKYVSKPDDEGYVFKTFRKDSIHTPYSFEEQNKIIEKKKQYIWKFLPETQLIKNDDGTYCIKQKYIEWKLLKFVDIDQLDEQVLSDLLELFHWYIAYCRDEWARNDIIWYQEDVDNIKNIRKRRFLFYSRIFNSLLSSTNIIISDDNKVYMIDVCDTIPVQNNQKLYKIKNAVRQAILELWIKKARSKIKHLIEEKRGELNNILW